jgi:hypothetical protein
MNAVIAFCWVFFSKSSDRQAIMEMCDSSLAQIITVLQVDIVIGIGKFAEYRIRETVKKNSLNVTVRALLIS